VNSFDITVYDKHEKAFLWNKVHQPVKGGKGIEQVVFPNGPRDIPLLDYTNYRKILEKPLPP
jgi:hypothetical protein